MLITSFIGHFYAYNLLVMTLMTTTLYRPINANELALIQELQYTGFPPRKPEQPFFYPVLNEEYASEITKKWNVSQFGIGYVKKFEVNSSFLEQFTIQNVGSFLHNEIWIPAKQMEEFNQNIIGKIEIISEFT